MARSYTSGEGPLVEEPGIAYRESTLQELHEIEVPPTHPLRRAKGDVGWPDTPEAAWPASVGGETPEGSTAFAGLKKGR